MEYFNPQKDIAPEYLAYHVQSYTRYAILLYIILFGLFLLERSIPLLQNTIVQVLLYVPMFLTGLTVAFMSRKIEIRKATRELTQYFSIFGKPFSPKVIPFSSVDEIWLPQIEDPKANIQRQQLPDKKVYPVIIDLIGGEAIKIDPNCRSYAKALKDATDIAKVIEVNVSTTSGYVLKIEKTLDRTIPS